MRFWPVFLALPAFATTCDGLKSLTIPNTTVVSAVAAANSCKVIFTAKPVADSQIKIEVWLPVATKWNGNFVGVGNEGYSGDLKTADMEMAFQKGYAVAGTDTGHSGKDLASFAAHPEQVIDWSYRAVHLMTETAKLAARLYYGRFPTRSYFYGCGTGGDQALAEAQRYPSDYDGVVAGSPGENRVRTNVGLLWDWKSTHDNGGFPVAKLKLLRDAAISVCDPIDGVKDGIVDDPRKCNFDPGSLQCRAGERPDCLTLVQAATVRNIYDGTRNPRTFDRSFAGLPRGSEASWDRFMGQVDPQRLEYWRQLVFNDPAWDFKTFDFDKDVVYAESKMATLISDSLDMNAFRQRGGKLLMYQGWGDTVVPGEEAIRYFTLAQQRNGGDLARLFMVPGMGHCASGPGPDQFDALAALDQWLATNQAPAQILATHSTNGAVERTRPLCAYPQVAKWDGTGNTEKAESFACKAP